jgi:Domain of unknown function (DUF4402)
MANGSLTKLCGIFGLAAAAILVPAPAAAQCRLCPAAPAAAKPPPEPVAISIDARLDFSRIGLVTANQGGLVHLDPLTGQRTVSGSLISLTGFPVQGSVTVRGEKNEQISVTFPTQITLSTTGGGVVTLSNITTTLKGNPKLDKDGTLTFTFGGQLQIDGTSDGDFRGSIPITVEYR